MKTRQSLYAVLAASALLFLCAIMAKPHEAVSTSARITVLETECQCALNGEQYDFCYRLPPEAHVKGRRFDCEHTHSLERLDLLSDKNVLNFEHQALPEPPFVTAMTDNHFKEGLTLIANIRQIFPRKKIYVYDLGLQTPSLNQLKDMCELEVRRFPFDDYPPYVKNIGEYRWKPLIIAETLNEFGAVWYMDTSVRWKKDKLDEVHSQVTCQTDHPRREDNTLLNNSSILCKKSGYLLHSSSGHGVFPTTHPGVYTYIPTDVEMLKKKSENHDAGFVFVAKTIESIKILKWYVLCALEKNCMAPSGARLRCQFGSDRNTQYANCHRYDQSVINLLLSNAYGYNARNYVSSLGSDGAVIDRAADTKLTKKDFLCNATIAS
ncbi:hypothetical protein Y032_0009g486 [Ancylostoma ceylanicum]|nr:hypothetical protein Y032_0009g486 [Ancylostoma ceylanicum]